MSKKWILSIFIIPILVFAQEEQNLLLANQFYQNQEYSKAIPLYQKLIKKDFDKYVYQNLFNALLQLKDYNEAIKLSKLAQKKTESFLIYKVDQGYVLSLDNNQDKADNLYKEIIKDIPATEYEINIIAERFSKYTLYDYALETYLTGQKQLKNRALFNEEIAQLHLAKQDLNNAILAFLTFLDFNSDKLEDIDGRFNQICDTKEKQELLKSILFKKVQKNPNNLIYAQLLISNLIQLKQYNEAFIQANALDKKTMSGGQLLVNFAEDLIQIKEYEIAAKSLEEVSKTGNNYYAFIANKRSLSVKKLLIENSYPIDTKMVETLIQSCQDFLDKNGYNIKTVDIAKDVAYLYGFYLEDYSKALVVIDKILSQSSIDRKSKGEVKLLKGDIELLSGDQWEAQLTYWQIDADFKESTIGHEAKYKVALLAYYTGDFEWCQNHLNALKGSTTKLISNDAIKLSTFITENYGKDSIITPVKLYAEAELLIYQKQYAKANIKLDTIIDIYPDHILMDDIQFKKANIAIQQNNDSIAIIHLNKIIDNYNNDLLIDDAIFTLAELYYKNDLTREKAKKLYESIIINHPDSIFVIEARKKYRILRGDNLN